MRTSKRRQPITKRFLRGVPRCLQQRTSLTSTPSKRASRVERTRLKFLPEPAATGRETERGSVPGSLIMGLNDSVKLSLSFSLSLSPVVYHEFFFIFGRVEHSRPSLSPGPQVNDVERREIYSHAFCLSFDTSRGLIVNCIHQRRSFNAAGETGHLFPRASAAS